MIRLLSVNFKGFKSTIEKGEYRVRVDGQDASEENLTQVSTYRLHEDSVVHIVPVISGAKRNGIFQVIIGAALIGAAFITGGASISAWGAISTSLAVAGGAMVLSGVVTMLTPVPEFGKGQQQENRSDSTSFSNLDNVEPQGRPVPVAYGLIMAGSGVVAQSLRTRDVEI